MKLIFAGDPVELERGEGLSRMSTSIYGVHFPMSVEVDVSHLSDKQKQKLLNNPHFRAAGVDAIPMPLVIPQSARAESAEAVDDQEEVTAPRRKRG